MLCCDFTFCVLFVACCEGENENETCAQSLWVETHKKSRNKARSKKQTVQLQFELRFEDLEKLGLSLLSGKCKSRKLCRLTSALKPDSTTTPQIYGRLKQCSSSGICCVLFTCVVWLTSSQNHVVEEITK